MHLDILLNATHIPGLYQAEARDGQGAVLGRDTFTHRPDLIASYYQLQALELGAVLGGADAEAAAALAANAEAFGRDLHARLLGGQLRQAWLDLR